MVSLLSFFLFIPSKQAIRSLYLNSYFVIQHHPRSTISPWKVNDYWGSSLEPCWWFCFLQRKCSPHRFPFHRKFPVLYYTITQEDKLYLTFLDHLSAAGICSRTIPWKLEDSEPFSKSSEREKKGDCANACDLSPQQGQQKPEPALETTTQSHLERLWLKAKKKLTVGDVKHFTLEPTKALSYGATEIYGCTVLVVVDGRSVTIGHFPQE